MEFEGSPLFPVIVVIFWSLILSPCCLHNFIALWSVRNHCNASIFFSCLNPYVSIKAQQVYDLSTSSVMEFFLRYHKIIHRLMKQYRRYIDLRSTKPNLNFNLRCFWDQTLAQCVVYKEQIACLWMLYYMHPIKY